MQEEIKTIRYHPSPCPECGGKLFLTTTRHGLGYICENIYEYGCAGSAGAHADGRTMGEPGTKQVRLLRKVLHNLLEPFWKQYTGKKSIEVHNQVYKLIGEVLAEKGYLSPKEEFHIANLTDEEHIKEVMRIAQTLLPRMFP